MTLPFLEHVGLLSKHFLQLGTHLEYFDMPFFNIVMAFDTFEISNDFHLWWTLTMIKLWCFDTRSFATMFSFRW